MPPTELYDAQGNQIRLGRSVGSGGEGKVYEVLQPDLALVAKIYHNQVEPAKQEKLAYMTRIWTDDLSAVSAWPVSTAHIARGGRIAGFLMAHLKGFEPIHKMYSPAQRKEFFPEIDWAFLVQVARNTAAAFHAIHRKGHVIADVNEQSIQVNSNATVKLIDCDSFQIEQDGRTHICGVGVRLFTPPELQDVTSFNNVVRTTNHDNFGLALICFHLLFMGRHPFAGIKPGAKEYQIEDAIREFAFAFGRDASRRGLRQPPGSLPLSVVIPELQALFEQAFCKGGAVPDNRPLAQAWVAALDKQRASLSTCPMANNHKYSRHIGDCPWCAVEGQMGTQFFPIAVKPTAVPRRTTVPVRPGVAPMVSNWSKGGREFATLAGHSKPVNSVAFSLDGRYFATGSDDNTAKLWSVPDGNCIATLFGHSGIVRAVAFSPDGRYLATGSRDNTAKLWSIPDGKCIATLSGHIYYVHSVAFSSDWRWLATGSGDNKAKLWSVPDGNCKATLSGHVYSVDSVAFSPDGRYLATGSRDKTAKLWSIPDGNCIATLSGHSYCVGSVAFSPDGRYLASGGYDGTAKLWSIPDGNCTDTLSGHSGIVRAVAFSPDGRYLASGSYDGTAKLWVPAG